MLTYLSLLVDDFPALSFLRLFKYVSFRAGGAAFTAFAMAVLLGPWTVRRLKSMQAHQRVRAEDLDVGGEAPKEQTPIMGGLLIIASILGAVVLWADPSNSLVWVFVWILASTGAVGFADDFMKVRKIGKDGMPGRIKLALQVLAAVIAVVWLDRVQGTNADGAMISRMLMVPFYKDPVIAAMPLALAVVFGVVVVVGASNAVNLSDGMDGLATGCTAVSAITYAVFAYACGHAVFADYLQVPFIRGSSEVVVIATAMAGASFGFLWHNCYPASMWMGDTGSLSLGAAIGLIAVLVKQELLLIVVGGVFVMEAGSVILQVGYFKLTRRLTGTPKRLFRCAPIHIHFRQTGYKETQIVIRFWIMAVVLAAIGVATLKIR